MSATAAPSVSLSSSCDGSRRIVDAAASADSDGSIAGYGRDFDGGTSGAGTTAEHVYRQPGRYTVKPTVTDDNGATGSAWTAIARIRLTARAYKLTRPQKVDRPRACAAHDCNRRPGNHVCRPRRRRRLSPSLRSPCSATVAEEIVDGRFTIATDDPHVKVAWRVTPLREKGS